MLSIHGHCHPTCITGENSFCIIWFYIIWYYMILYDIILYCILLYYIIVYCIILYYIILYHIILYYIILYIYVCVHIVIPKQIKKRKTYTHVKLYWNNGKSLFYINLVVTVSYIYIQLYIHIIMIITIIIISYPHDIPSMSPLNLLYSYYKYLA